jgi:hypothetical protein
MSGRKVEKGQEPGLLPVPTVRIALNNSGLAPGLAFTPANSQAYPLNESLLRRQILPLSSDR